MVFWKSETLSDPTYGRYFSPLRTYEQHLDSRPDVLTIRRRVFLPLRTDVLSHQVTQSDGEDVKEGELNKAKSERWIYYKTWELRAENRKPGSEDRGLSVLMAHGYSEYGGRYAYHLESMVDRGYRVIAPDMPGFGRSTGLHGYLESHLDLLVGIYVPLQDQKILNSQPRRTVVCGASMGGLAAMLSAAYLNSVRGIGQVVGVYAMCPLLGVDGTGNATWSNAKLPKWALSIVKATIGALPIIILGGHTLPELPDQESWAYRDEVEKTDDALLYKGNCRVNTGLAFLEGMADVKAKVSQISCPFRIIHGDADLATSHLMSQRIYNLAPSQDKSIFVLPGFEHALIKVIQGEETKEDQDNNKIVMDDWMSWVQKFA